MEQSIIIARPVAAVFAYRSALEQTREWQTDVLATQLATVAPVAVGTHGTESRRSAKDILSEWDILITEFELNHVLEIVSSCGAVHIRERDFFTASDDGGTRYTTHVEMTGSPLPVSVFHKRTVEELTRLRRRLEAQV